MVENRPYLTVISHLVVILGIVITVADESWTVDANMLDLEVMGIGWFDMDMVADTDDFARPEIARTIFVVPNPSSLTLIPHALPFTLGIV